MKDALDRNQIKQWLQRGDLKRLSRQHGIDTSTASKVLNGKAKHMAFLEALINQAIENKTKITGGMERLKSIGA